MTQLTVRSLFAHHAIKRLIDYHYAYALHSSDIITTIIVSPPGSDSLRKRT